MAALLGPRPESFPDGTAPPSVKVRAAGRPKQDILLFCVYEGRPSLCACPFPQKSAGHPAAVPGAAGPSLRPAWNTNGIKVCKKSKKERGAGKSAERKESRGRAQQIAVSSGPAAAGRRGGGAGARAPSRGTPPADRFCGTPLALFLLKNRYGDSRAKGKAPCILRCRGFLCKSYPPVSAALHRAGTELKQGPNPFRGPMTLLPAAARLRPVSQPVLCSGRPLCRRLLLKPDGKSQEQKRRGTGPGQGPRQYFGAFWKKKGRAFLGETQVSRSLLCIGFFLFRAKSPAQKARLRAAAGAKPARPGRGARREKGAGQGPGARRQYDSGEKQRRATRRKGAKQTLCTLFLQPAALFFQGGTAELFFQHVALPRISAR